MKTLMILSIIFELYHGPESYHIEVQHVDTYALLPPIGKELHVKLCEAIYSSV